MGKHGQRAAPGRKTVHFTQNTPFTTTESTSQRIQDMKSKRACPHMAPVVYLPAHTAFWYLMCVWCVPPTSIHRIYCPYNNAHTAYSTPHAVPDTAGSSSWSRLTVVTTMVSVCEVIAVTV